MKIFTKNLKVIILIMMLVMTSLCQASPNNVIVTGRTQKLKVEEKQVLDIAQQQYMDYMKAARLSTNITNTAMLKRVGQYLANAITEYANYNGYSSDIANYKWTFNLVQDSKAYAWCMPGGLVVVSEGLLPITQDEESLAVILGHEIAHAIARHHLEILSTQVKKWKVNKIDATSLAKAITDNGFSFNNVSFNPEQESEADRIGMIFASMAGYDPQPTKSFWQRLVSANNTQAYLSCHPSLETRMKQIDYCMPEALKYYNPRKVRTTTSQKTIVKKENTGSSTIPESKPVRSSTAATTTPTPTNTVKASSSQGAVKSNQKRIALIIGNGGYSSGRLANPVNDANDLRKKISSLGFETIARTNCNLQGMMEDISSFCKKAKQYDVALFFYAGHAFQDQGVNYLVPINAIIDSRADIEFQCVSLNWILRKMEEVGVNTKIIILDACRDNPIAQAWERGMTAEGLSAMGSVPQGTFLVYSAQAGKKAKDGEGQRNSPYTSALLKFLDTPMLPIHELFRQVRNEVARKTNNEQVPSQTDNLLGDFYFNTTK